MVEGQVQPREVHEEVDVLDLGDAVVVQAQLRQRPAIHKTGDAMWQREGMINQRRGNKRICDAFEVEVWLLILLYDGRT